MKACFYIRTICSSTYKQYTTTPCLKSYPLPPTYEHCLLVALQPPPADLFYKHRNTFNPFISFKNGESTLYGHLLLYSRVAETWALIVLLLKLACKCNNWYHWWWCWQQPLFFPETVLYIAAMCHSYCQRMAYSWGGVDDGSAIQSISWSDRWSSCSV